MPIRRCPACGRVNDGARCLACGTELTRDARARAQAGQPAATQVALPAPVHAGTWSEPKSRSAPTTQADEVGFHDDAATHDTRISALPAAVDFGSDTGQAIAADVDHSQPVFQALRGEAIVAPAEAIDAEATLRASPAPGISPDNPSDVFTQPSSDAASGPGLLALPGEEEATLVNAQAPSWTVSASGGETSTFRASPTRESVVQEVRGLALRLERRQQIHDAALLYQALALLLQHP